MNSLQKQCVKIEPYKDKIITKLYVSYIEFVARTSQIELKGDMDKHHLSNAMIGFWHEDSFGMNFLLRALKDWESQTHIVITKDKRGDYIEEMILNYGAKSLRMPDGAAIRPFLQELKEVSKLEGGTLCIALDGPLGPHREPKKLTFMLSEYAQKNCILMQVDYKRAIRLHKRWDHYAIPLPFNRMTFTAYPIGVVEKQQLREFKIYQQIIKNKFKKR